jgi:hypothetical protein
MGTEVSPTPACTLATLPVLFEAAALALIVVLEEYPAAASPIAATTKTKPSVILVFII